MFHCLIIIGTEIYTLHLPKAILISSQFTVHWLLSKNSIKCGMFCDLADEKARHSGFEAHSTPCNGEQWARSQRVWGSHTQLSNAHHVVFCAAQIKNTVQEKKKEKTRASEHKTKKWHLWEQERMCPTTQGTHLHGLWRTSRLSESWQSPPHCHWPRCSPSQCQSWAEFCFHLPCAPNERGDSRHLPAQGHPKLLKQLSFWFHL